MPDEFLGLPRETRLEALEYAAAVTGRPTHLLEKDVWVVWALRALFTSRFGQHLSFKGGTSLSKAYGLIQRFSEDVDLTYDIRALAGRLVGHDGEPHPSSRSEARRWSDAIRKELLPAWVSVDARETLQAALDGGRLAAEVRVDGDQRDVLHLDYAPVAAASSYTSHAVKLEFGARSTGEPCAPHDVVCDAAGALPTLAFPTARPRVLRAERTFWEKATAMHVFALGGKPPGSHRFARHWYDLSRLHAAGVARRAIDDRALARAVAEHKRWFFEMKGRDGSIDYLAAVRGGLKLVPEASRLEPLRVDYAAMVDDGLVLGSPPTFEEVLAACREVERVANEAGAAGV